MQFDIKFNGVNLPEYDINENTTIGIELYNTALLPSVNLFLEVGTQYGGSARCIGSGLLNSDGHLHTIEAIESRVIQARENLKGLPITCHWASTGDSDGLKDYYNKHRHLIQQESTLLSDLLENYKFDAVFLDSCVKTQQLELEKCVTKQIKHILMHEPDQKCPSYEKMMPEANYQLIAKGTDRIKSGNPLWVHYYRG